MDINFIHAKREKHSTLISDSENKIRKCRQTAVKMFGFTLVWSQTDEDLQPAGTNSLLSEATLTRWCRRLLLLHWKHSLLINNISDNMNMKRLKHSFSWQSQEIILFLKCRLAIKHSGHISGNPVHDKEKCGFKP